MPADLVVLHSSGNEGVFYVETKGLDGETNLKLKSVNPEIQKEYQRKEINIDADIQCDNPNANLYKYEGRIDFPDGSMGSDSDAMRSVPLESESIVLRGMSLRNTESIIGVVVYTGHETKILMNSAEATYKKSRLDRFTDNAVFWLFIV